MIIDCIACPHGHYPELDGGDLLIVAGDLTKSGARDEYLHFGQWIQEQSYRTKIVVCGNHDARIEKIHHDCKIPDDLKLPRMFINPFALFGCEYLCDSGTEFEDLKIWGSPWTKWFEGVNPKCTAFMLKTEEELAEKFAMIPDDVDILVTHSPPYGMRDHLKDGTPCGSRTLLRKTSPHCKLHVFGHIHEEYGHLKLFDTHYVNASHVNERYEPVNKPIRVIL